MRGIVSVNEKPSHRGWAFFIVEVSGALVISQ